MTQWAVVADDLGKRYRISDTARPNSFLGAVRDTFGIGLNAAKTTEEFWALRNVSFEVGIGKRLGIVGANGAGKSTLLKILSRITSPTEGEARLRGRVASLLEVGTGFHPELTGRENIYLNGTILGLSRNDINKAFDSIVDYSGVEAFIDTPIKHYSSGMHVRLAFSVAAQLEPDIMIIDEVLAVGDAAFQRKCQRTIDNAARDGRTILLVSHSMATVNLMCETALYIEKGRVVSYGPVEEATIEYQRDVIEATEQGPWHRAAFAIPDKNIELYSEREGEVECIGGQVRSEDGGSSPTLPIDRSIRITLWYRILKNLAYPAVANFHVYDELGARVFISMPEAAGPQQAGEHSATCIIPPFQLNNGRFTVALNVSSFTEEKPVHFAALNALRFEVVELSTADPRRHGWRGALPGVSRPRLDWQFDAVSLRDAALS
jgi:lipopolysaccharide transport system ATP-binding protein